MTTSADRHLLFGLIALRIGFVNRAQLIAAAALWSRDKSQSLAEILVEQKALSTADRELLEPLVARHIENHGNAPASSLATLGDIHHVAEELKQLGDKAITASLSKIYLGPTANSLPQSLAKGGEGIGTAGDFRSASPQGAPSADQQLLAKKAPNETLRAKSATAERVESRQGYFGCALALSLLVWILTGTMVLNLLTASRGASPLGNSLAVLMITAILFLAAGLSTLMGAATVIQRTFGWRGVLVAALIAFNLLLVVFVSWVAA